MPSRAQRVIEFTERYCIARLDPWERRWLRGVYATNPDGSLKHSRGLLSCAKANGKTEIMAAVVLAHLVGPERGYAERLVSAAGGSKDQAGFVYKAAERMLLGNDEMASRVEAVPSTMRLVRTDTGSYYEALPTNSRSVHGQKPRLWVFDELAQALDSTLYSALDLAQGPISDPLGLVVSTMSDRPGQPMADLVAAVEAGVKNGQMKHWHMAIYRAPRGIDEFSWAAIRLANPGLGTILDRVSVRREREEAMAMPSRRSAWRAYRLNQDADAEDALVDETLWAATADESLRLEDLAGERCYAALDLSHSTSLTSSAYWFPDAAVLLVENWLPADVLGELEQKHRAPYRAWAESGALRTTPGATIRLRTVIERLAYVQGLVDLREVRHDRYRVVALREDVREMGLDLPLREMGQGYASMGPATDEFLRLLASGEFRHDGNPVTTMCVRNTGAKRDRTSTSGQAKPVRLRPGLPIDSCVASIEAVARLAPLDAANEDNEQGFVFL